MAKQITDVVSGALGAQVSVLTLLLTLVAGAVGFVLYWRHRSKALQKELKIEVKREAPPAQEASAKRNSGQVNEESAAEAAKSPFVAALELNKAACATAPFSDYAMCSLGDYYRSLDAGPAGLSLERIAATVLSKGGYGALLPAVDLLAPKSTKEALGGADALFGGYGESLLRKLLSPLKIYAISSALNEASADAAELNLGVEIKDAVPGEQEKTPAIATFVSGEQDGLSPPYPHIHTLPETFVLERDIPSIMDAWGITKDDETEPLKPEPGSPDLLPDLCFSYGGLPSNYAPWNNGISRIVSKLLNRLAANAVVASPTMAEEFSPPNHKGPISKPFTVYMTEEQEAKDERGMTRPDELVVALKEAGHEVEMGIVSRTTSFGFGLSVKEADGSYTNVPIIVPLDSGLRLFASSDAADSRHDKITMPGCHAGLFIKIKGPMIADCFVEWYQGLEGFTGWHNGCDTKMVWANDSVVEIRHDKPRWTSPEQWTAAFETSTVVSIALNVSATRSRLPNGGYGYLGICMDSTAAIQQALTGRVSLFPLILGGQAKACVMLLYKELEAALTKDGNQHLANAAAALRHAMSQVPNDIIHEPQNTARICDRMLSMLPEQSPFALVAETRSKVQKLREQSSELAAEGSNAKKFSNTRAKSCGKAGVPWLQIQGPWSPQQ